MSRLQPNHRLRKKKDSMDILVEDNEMVRPISNASGGETFCISLALALAMAEFAGENGGVDALFLDEGFGTLSGEPLMNAIDSLKRLGSTGKLLGIITHVSEVIDAFDLKLVATKRKTMSELSGPGVHHEMISDEKQSGRSKSNA